MARKRTKKEAQDRIPRLRTPPIGKLIPPLRIPLAVLQGAERGARALIELDPLNRLAPDTVPSMAIPRETSVQRLAKVVNDPAIVVDDNTMAVINDPAMAMSDMGEVMIRANGGQTSDFSNQFRRDKILPSAAKKTKRRKNPKLAAAFREANAKMRTKSGKLRKGKTQTDIARLAHRLLKRM
jgi:hypothetical protein